MNDRKWKLHIPQNWPGNIDQIVGEIQEDQERGGVMIQNRTVKIDDNEKLCWKILRV